MSSKLDLLATNLAAYLEAAPELVVQAGLPAIEVLTEQKGNINSTVTAALQKLGVAVVVVVSDTQLNDTGDAKGLHNVRLIAEVTETYATNKTGRRCLAVAEACDRAAHGKPNGLGPVLGRERSFRLAPGPNLRLVPHPTQTVRHVVFTTDVML